jgi:FKBP-type peptidyl-prolyl cis-trans isomerase 2
MAGKTLNFDVELVEIKSSGSIKIEEVENFENDFVEEVE